MGLDEVETDIRRFQHEVLNRISIMTAYCYLLREEPLSDDQTEMVDEIDKAAVQAKELILGLTDDDVERPGPRP